MKKLLAAGFSLALTCASISPAFAATVPTVEPSNGFTRGPNPEWQTGHASQSSPEHRVYHQQEEQAHLRWHTEHNATNTLNYEDVHRMLHQDRNMRHRHYHNPPAPEPTIMPSDDNADEETNDDVEDEDMGNDDAMDSQAPGRHTYTGNKPTKRSIIAAAKERERERAAQLGQ